MPHIALSIHPQGIAVVPCTYVTLAGEQFALCRPPLPVDGIGAGLHLSPAIDPKWWEVVDPETGEFIAVGQTKRAALDHAALKLAGLNPGSLQRARERVLLQQWGATP